MVMGRLLRHDQAAVGRLARCQVREQDSTLIDLTLSVPSEEQAQAVCAHWKDKSQEIYAYVMQNLL